MAAIFVFVVDIKQTSAQNLNHELMFWPTLYLQTKSHRGFKGTFEVQPRVATEPSDFNSILLRPYVDYDINRNLQVGAGYAWVPLFTKKGFIDEQRPFQEATVQLERGKFKLINRFRLEERFFDVFGFSLRLRHRIMGFYPIDKEGRWSLVAWNELFINLNDPGKGPKGGFDQDRFYLGVSRKVSDRITVNLGYQPVFVDRRQPIVDQYSHAIRMDVGILTF